MSDVPIRTIEKKPHRFLEKIIALYGANNSGKTTVLRDILKVISNHIPNVEAFSPTSEQNGSLDGIVPKRLIKKKLTIYQR